MELGPMMGTLRSGVREEFRLNVVRAMIRRRPLWTACWATTGVLAMRRGVSR